MTLVGAAPSQRRFPRRSLASGAEHVLQLLQGKEQAAGEDPGEALILLR